MYTNVMESRGLATFGSSCPRLPSVSTPMAVICNVYDASELLVAIGKQVLRASVVIH